MKIAADATSYQANVFDKADYLKLSYKLSGGVRVTIFNHRDDLITKQVSQSISDNGRTLWIGIDVITSAKNETFEVKKSVRKNRWV